jgi:tetratricopeptide (TPR) repeat protein
VTLAITPQSGRPPALAALDGYLLLRASVETSLARQEVALARWARRYQPSLLAEVDRALQQVRSGVIALVGPPGSGVTSLLAHLAASHPYAFWFCDEDSAQGAVALCVQLIGLYRVQVPLPPPAANSDPKALEQFLAGVAAQHAASQQDPDNIQPIVLVIDAPAPRQQPSSPLPLVFPATLPDHLLILYGCTPDTPLPFTPDIHISLPLSGNEIRREQALTLQADGCPPEWFGTLVAAAQGNFLFLRIAAGLVKQGVLDKASLRVGLESLYEHWWGTLDEQGQRLALMMAAAGESLPIALCNELLGIDAVPLLDTWEAIGIVTRRTASTDSEVLFAHWSLEDYLARQHPTALAQVHADIVEYTLRLEQGGSYTSQGATGEKGGGEKAMPDPSPSPVAGQAAAHRAYLNRNFARHAALGTYHTRHTLLPMVAQRPWVRNQERRSGNLFQASRDLAWELYTTTDLAAYQEQETAEGETCKLDEMLLRVGRSVVLTGTLLSLSRSLAPDVAVEALNVALEQLGRETGLKRVLDVVEQLPDGRSKAQVFRKLGEACYAAKMRSSAMRLLSQALDLEEQRIPASWQEQRDQLLTALARAALDQHEVDAALEISGYIGHIEKRGMAETVVVRHLLGIGELLQARRVAGAIHHESLGAWAMAEVAVAQARSGDTYTAEMLLADIATETARAWAEIELACDQASHDAAAAKSRIEQLESSNQQEHGLARLSETLARAGQETEALQVAKQIGTISLRVSTLLNLRSVVGTTVAMAALEQANAAIKTLQDDMRVPLVTMLAAAYASLGHQQEALDVASQLSTEEERDRAHSRVAVALTQAGYHREGLEIARGLSDQDERDWTLDELARVFSEHGAWQEAQALALEIKDDRDRDRALANVCIALLQTGAPLPALWLTRKIETPYERSRALTIIAPLLVAAGHTEEAINASEAIGKHTDTKKPVAPLRSEQTSRYLAAIAMALTEQGDPDRSLELIPAITVPFEQARCFLAIALATAPHNLARSFAALGKAIRLATTDRAGAFRVLEQAAPVLALAGGTNLLVSLARAVKEIDAWW